MDTSAQPKEPALLTHLQCGAAIPLPSIDHSPLVATPQLAHPDKLGGIQMGLHEQLKQGTQGRDGWGGWRSEGMRGIGESGVQSLTVAQHTAQQAFSSSPQPAA